MNEISIATWRGCIPGSIVKHFKRETLTKEELEKNQNMYLYEIVGKNYVRNKTNHSGGTYD